VHRAAWIARHGEPPPETPFVLHHCDRPSCFADRHLWLGTHKDNMADMVAKGRRSKLARHAREELHPSTSTTAPTDRTGMTHGSVTSVRTLTRDEPQRAQLDARLEDMHADPRPLTLAARLRRAADMLERGEMPANQLQWLADMSAAVERAIKANPNAPRVPAAAAPQLPAAAAPQLPAAAPASDSVAAGEGAEEGGEVGKLRNALRWARGSTSEPGAPNHGDAAAQPAAEPLSAPEPGDPSPISAEGDLAASHVHTNGSDFDADLTPGAVLVGEDGTVLMRRAPDPFDSLQLGRRPMHGDPDRPLPSDHPRATEDKSQSERSLLRDVNPWAEH